MSSVDQTGLTQLTEGDADSDGSLFETVIRSTTRASARRIQSKSIPDSLTTSRRNVLVIDLQNAAVLDLPLKWTSKRFLFAKRAMDIVFSIFFILLCLPIVAIIALLVKLNSPGKILYKSTRVGHKGLSFNLYKFRTMIKNAHDLKADLEHLNEREGVLFKVSNDPRVTTIGRILRKYSLDELPQLWNVLKGDMSLVGPRPPMPEEFAQYTRLQARRMGVKPGLTGLWQISARNHPSFDKYVELDIEYIERWSFLLDIEILIKTLPAVLRGTGV